MNYRRFIPSYSVFSIRQQFCLPAHTLQRTKKGCWFEASSRVSLTRVLPGRHHRRERGKHLHEHKQVGSIITTPSDSAIFTIYMYPYYLNKKVDLSKCLELAHVNPSVF